MTGNNDTLLIVGNGPVGVHLVNELYRLGYEGPLTLFGEEPYAPYNRVQLSSLLNGSCAWQSLNTEVLLRPHWQTQYHTRITDLELTQRLATDNHGNRHPYRQLVLATGSQPHIPAIPGTSLKGVFAFRNFDDAQRLMGRQVSSRHTVVVGGGLLGIETARAMAKYGTRVTLIHHSPVLMSRQLDETASALLQKELKQDGVGIALASGVLAIDGAREVKGVLLRGGGMLACDTVIFATGIRPAVDLARQAGIAVGLGIRINTRLETSETRHYAIGECAELNGRIFGLVAPGLEQAAILARRLTNPEDDSEYREVLLSSSLKVVQTPVFSAGAVGDAFDSPGFDTLAYQRDGVYRKLVFARRRLVGAIALGDWPEAERLKIAIDCQQRLSTWRRWLFKRNGVLWSDDSNPAQLAANIIICNCRQVNAGEIRACIAEGAHTLESLGQQCGAGTVCGSCQPLLARFTTTDTRPTTQGHWPLVGWAAMVLVLLVTFYALPPLAISDQYSLSSLDHWWSDSSYRQISGFTMLGLLSLGMLVGLRKRIKRFRFLTFATWRWFHVVLSTLCLAILFLHTGLGATQGLNRWLMLCFSSAVGLGVVATVLTHWESRSPGIMSKSVKRWLTTAHLASVWPLPVLLSFHILSVYWF